MSQKKGFVAQDHAKRFLLAQGLRDVMSNYRCRAGEIDLIMRDGHYLVFIEVRARTSSVFGDAISSITKSKQQRIMKTAHWYLLEHRVQSGQAIRFDVLGLDGVPANITWIKDAFGMDY